MRAVGLMAVLSAVLCVAAPAWAQEQQQPPLAIRFCPTGQLRPYPLDAKGRMQGLLLQGFTVVNQGEAPIKLEEIDISMLAKGQVVDNRVLDAAALDRWAGNGPPIQALIRKYPVEYCSRDIVPAGIVLGGSVLQRNQGMIVVQEVFAYDRPRDNLRVSVLGASGGHPVNASASIPIVAGFAKNRFVFPLSGVWYVGEGPSFHTAHRIHPGEEFALDIGQLGEGGRTYRGDGLSLRDYYAYGAPVLAAADGRVVRTHDGQAENPGALQRPGETSDAYLARHAAELDKGVASTDLNWAAGNYVMIDHGGAEYSLYAHLQPGSVRVKVGDQVHAGAMVGSLGSSGNSSEPHLHFQVCDRPDPFLCAGIPVAFGNLIILWADGPRALQSGDIVTTR
jgi:murein DD-endopeptidase MepM/ murein hydrolase activator NlpD